MLVNESIWIKNVFEEKFTEQNFPLLNIGSSTEDFRKNTQPHIYKNIFEPLKLKNFKVIHTDMKKEEGVDMVGDLNDKGFRDKLAAENIKSVLCSNLLEHLEDPQKICDSILDLLKKNDLILVTVPYSFPYHVDPIDTMLRPTIAELHAFFPGTEITASEIVEQNTSFKTSLMENKKYFLIMAVRWALPFYKFKEWKLSIRDLLKWNRKHSVTCILLKKK